jgi:hypothetical protein
MMDLVEAIHSQCHEHLRDADKKRDELVAFYALVIGLLFAGYRQIDDDLRPLLVFVVGLVGFFAVLTVIHYRKWHAIYSNCLRAMERAAAASRNSRLTRTGILEAWNSLPVHHSSWRTWQLFNPLAGTEAATFDALLVLSFLPWYLVPNAVPDLALLTVPNHVVGFVLGLAIYMIIMTLAGVIILNRDLRKDPFEHWVLRPFHDWRDQM